MRALVRGGAWRWALALGFAIALGGGAWAYDVFGPEIRAFWPMWKAEGKPWLRETLLWIEFASSITLTVATLCWFTSLFFCVLCALFFGLSRLLDRCSVRALPEQGLARMRRAMNWIVQHDRLLGSIANALASLAALAVLRILLKRPLDLWDIGIQIMISAAVQLIVLQILFPRGRLDWPWRKPSD